MLNEEYKRITIEDLENANEKYTKTFQNTLRSMERLFMSRQRAVNTIKRVEGYVTSVANKPRDYDTTLGEIRVRYLDFQNKIEDIKKLDANIGQTNAGRGFGAGIAFGAGAAAFTPSIAMAAAMTFGTASTGAAISTLSGVAATNAALAWLGGGAIAAGGAGIVGGQAVLSMAGPIGWVIGGVTAGGSLLAKAITNNQIAKKAEEATRVLIKETERIKEIDAQVNSWNKETIVSVNELTKKLTFMRRKKDYTQFTKEDKEEFNILMNATEILSKKIQETIDNE